MVVGAIVVGSPPLTPSTVMRLLVVLLEAARVHVESGRAPRVVLETE